MRAARSTSPAAAFASARSWPPARTWTPASARWRPRWRASPEMPPGRPVPPTPWACLHAADPLPGGRGSWPPPRSPACTASRAATLARLRALHAWAVGAQGRSDGVRAETDVAWADAQAAGDPLLELDVLEHVNAARDEIGEAGETDWALLEEKALAVGRWHQVVVAGRIRAVLQSDTDPACGPAATGGGCRAGIGARADRAGRLGELLADRGAVGDGALGRGARASAAR